MCGHQVNWGLISWTYAYLYQCFYLGCTLLYCCYRKVWTIAIHLGKHQPQWWQHAPLFYRFCVVCGIIMPNVFTCTGISWFSILFRYEYTVETIHWPIYQVIVAERLMLFHHHRVSTLVCNEFGHWALPKCKTQVYSCLYSRSISAVALWPFSHRPIWT